MSTSTAFVLVFFVGAAPFWTLMIAAPNWRVTQRVMSSPWSVTLSLVFWYIYAIPRLLDLLPAVLRPTLEKWQELTASPEALTFTWAQIIAWDLFVGRWVYLDSRERNIHPAVMAPILLLTITLSPIAVPLYLLIRKPLTRSTPTEAIVEPAIPVGTR
ncbi:ABA4-like family protein [Actinophytocola glycyrrhizae]|uniref:ABA4-like family protein n=1 Tax=Actinophytocola glycyrrhizae TaxID=2044873 RepID=A0ABV9RVS2_9PSEU